MHLRKFLLTSLLFLATATALAQDVPASSSSAPATPDQLLDQARGQVDEINKALKGGELKENAEIDDLRSKAAQAQADAQQATQALVPQVEAVNQRLTDYGPAPAKGVTEPADVAAARRDLQKQHDALDAQVKLARDTATQSTQLATQLVNIKRQQFQSRLASRSDSPLTREFWTGPADTFARDRALLRQLGSDISDDMHTLMTPPNRVPFIGFALAGLLLVTVARWLIERTVFRLTTNRVPAGKLRRSSMALGISLVATLTSGFGALLFSLGMTWHKAISDDVTALAHHFVTVVFYVSFIAGVSRALLSRKRPSWRLPHLSDDLVEKIFNLPRLIALAGFIMIFGYRVNTTIGVSVDATAMLNCFSALLISGLIGFGLVQLARAHRVPAEDGDLPPPRPVWANLLIMAASIAVVITWIAALLGYVSLAVTIAVQMVWIGMVGSGVYLLTHLADDLFDTLLSSSSRLGQRAVHALGIEPNKLDQLSVLAAGIARVVLFLAGLSVATQLFGTGPSDIVAFTSRFTHDIALGNELKIKPGNIIDAIFAFIVGMIVVRVLKRWMEDKLLPQTSIDAGMRSSITTLLGYLGGVIVFAMAMLTLGLSVANVTWVASALSVGIGFGLQAIVSNFISGLILLVERPVKVGDWVVLDDAEGDIRRINVRATEIRVADQSTVIVPNSFLITKTVRNMTLANPQGRVLIKLPMPLDTDAGNARELMLTAMREHSLVLDAPAPTVTLDSVDHTAMNFVATCFVDGPRAAGGVKSDLLFEILKRLRDAAIPLIRPQDMVIRGGAMPDAAGESTP
jgi:small-conductance mechanosensitive channel